MFLLFGAFIAGLLTVLAPCVLPMLPIIIGGSVSGDVTNRKRPLIIVASLAISLIVFTVLLKVTTLFINVPPRVITYVSGGIIIGLGIVMLFPSLYARVLTTLGIEQRSQSLLGKGFGNKSQLIGAIITGAALGPVFSSCSPVYAYILATVLPVSVAWAFAYIIAYVIGLGTILLLIGFYGQRFTRRIRFASNPNGWFQRTIAVIFIVVGLLVFTGSVTKVQTWVSDHTPFNFDGLSSKLLPASKNKQDNTELYNVQAYNAPEFVGLQNWINSKPMTMKQLRGKVVLVDFWTYSCINCIRNNPYIEQWYKSYKNDGLVVVGVHAPEFSFEKITANVEKAVQDQHITYPVALDNNLQTWSAFNNESWPASYLINPDGKVVRIHEGEGGYTQEEQAIRQLLTDNGAKLGKQGTTTANDAVPISELQTPETYVGTDRASDYVGVPNLDSVGQTLFTPATSLNTNDWTLGGTWNVMGDKIESVSNSTISIHVAAKNVYLVAGAEKRANVVVLVDGKPIQQTSFSGSDVQDGSLPIAMSQLYRLASFPQFSSAHTITLQVPAGVNINTFTFGS
ncbi:MAG: cytochrome c biogenesis protein CcdA [Candidatus Saccharibacteria bacterium]